MWWDMLGVKLLFLDQAELAAEDEKRTKAIRHTSMIATLLAKTLSKLQAENNLLRLKTRCFASTTSDGLAYCLIQGQAQGRLMLRLRWRPQQMAADLGAQMAPKGADDCWMADAEWSACDCCRLRVDSADCQNRTRPSPSVMSQGGSLSARVPIGLRPEKKKITQR